MDFGENSTCHEMTREEKEGTGIRSAVLEASRARLANRTLYVTYTGKLASPVLNSFNPTPMRVSSPIFLHRVIG